MKQLIKIQNVIFFLSVFLSSCTSCNKTPIEPPYKQGYYFYCKVDGKDFIQAKNTGIGGSSLQTAYNNDSLIFIGSLSENFEDIAINVNKIISQNPYSINKQVSYTNSNFAYYKRVNTSLNDISTDSIHTGIMNITLLDTKNKIIEGNFAFKAINYSLHDSVNITDGKFSLIYQ